LCAIADADTANNLYKGIQLATMKVLRNTDQTAVITTLLEMLDDLLGSSSGSSGSEPAFVPPKGFAEVLVKALGIAVQHLKETIDELNLDQVLHDINLFLESHHAVGSRNVAAAAAAAGTDAEADVSMKAKLRQECVRLCQAAVKEIVNLKGRAGVSRHLTLVPVAQYPTPGPYPISLLFPSLLILFVGLCSGGARDQQGAEGHVRDCGRGHHRR
jgi:hypothetical protein